LGFIYSTWEDFGGFTAQLNRERGFHNEEVGTELFKWEVTNYAEWGENLRVAEEKKATLTEKGKGERKGISTRLNLFSRMSRLRERRRRTRYWTEKRLEQVKTARSKKKTRGKRRI